MGTECEICGCELNDYIRCVIDGISNGLCWACEVKRLRATLEGAYWTEAERKLEEAEAKLARFHNEDGSTKPCWEVYDTCDRLDLRKALERLQGEVESLQSELAAAREQDARTCAMVDAADTRADENLARAEKAESDLELSQADANSAHGLP